jgi:translation initiation factor eIF-2B subunit beta
LSPHAIMADGGAISVSGHLVVATAAKEFLVPVVSIAGSFSLTPLFAHNQTLALQQLQSPVTAIPYDSDVNFSNVEVVFPAFDHLPPDFISLYVTNDGSQLPSYMFRLLSEHYHPKDYTL